MREQGGGEIRGCDLQGRWRDGGWEKREEVGTEKVEEYIPHPTRKRSPVQSLPPLNSVRYKQVNVRGHTHQHTPNHTNE